MSKTAEIFFAIFIFLSAIAFAIGMILNIQVLFIPLNYQHTPAQTFIFLAVLFSGILIGYAAITVFINVFLKKCDCCKKHGLIKKVILANHYAEKHEKEYEFCFSCRAQEVWKKNEELFSIHDHSIIHTFLI